MKLRLIAAVSLLAASTALAVVPGGRTVLLRFAARQALDRATASPLLGQVVVPGRSQTSAGRVELKFPGSCSTQFDLPEGHTQVTLAGGSVSHQGASNPPLEAFVALACPLFALKNVPSADASTALEKLASSWGVDTGVSALNLLGDRAAYVVGAKPKELTRPQIWFDKETERPIRVIAAYGGKLWDLRFEEPTSIATNGLAPRVTQVWHDSNLVLTLHLMAQDVKPPTPAASAPEETDEESE